MFVKRYFNGTLVVLKVHWQRFSDFMLALKASMTYLYTDPKMGEYKGKYPEITVTSILVGRIHTVV